MYVAAAVAAAFFAVALIRLGHMSVYHQMLI